MKTAVSTLTTAFARTMTRVDAASPSDVTEAMAALAAIRDADALVKLVGPLVARRARKWLVGSLDRAERALRPLERDAHWRRSLEAVTRGDIVPAGAAKSLAADLLARRAQPSAGHMAVAVLTCQREVAGLLDIFAANVEPGLDWSDIEESLVHSVFEVRQSARRCLKRPTPRRTRKLALRIRRLAYQVATIGESDGVLDEVLEPRLAAALESQLPFAHDLLNSWMVMHRGRRRLHRTVADTGVSHALANVMERRQTYLLGRALDCVMAAVSPEQAVSAHGAQPN